MEFNCNVRKTHFPNSDKLVNIFNLDIKTISNHINKALQEEFRN